MSKESDLIKLREDEKEIARQITALQQRSAELQNQPEKAADKQNLDDIITSRQASLAEIQNEIKAVEQNVQEKESNWKMAAAGVAFHTASLFNQAHEYVEMQHNITEPAKQEIVIDQQKAAPELVCKEPEQQILQEGPSGKLQNIQEEKIEPTKHDLEKGSEKIQKGLEEAYQQTHEVPIKKEGPENDVADKWKNDIEAKETVLRNEKEKEFQNLEKNKAKQEVDISDAKKIPDKQMREEMVGRLEEAVKNQKIEIEKKFEPKFEELQKEKEALQKAIDSTQGMNMQERNQEIQRQREEYERQRELERQRQNERTR